MKAFLNFLIFFSITVTIIIVVIFFSIEVPFIDNRRLRNQVAEFQNQKELTRSLRVQINDAAGLIKTLDSKDINLANVDAHINASVDAINGQAKGAADTLSKKFYFTLTEILQSWQKDKKNLSNAKTSEEEAARLNQEILILKTQLAQKDQTIASLMQQHP